MDPIDIIFNILYKYVKKIVYSLLILNVTHADVAYAKSACLLQYYIYTRVLYITRVHVCKVYIIGIFYYYRVETLTKKCLIFFTYVY